MAIQKEVTRDYCARRPDMPTKTLADMMYAENPSVFKSAEAARSAVRKERGNAGTRHREIKARAGETEFFRPNGVPGFNMWEALPDPIGDFGSTVAVPVEQERILVLSDIHFPFHDKNALMSAVEYGKMRGADAIILNGDTLDCHTLSRFVTDPRLRDFGREVDYTKTFLRLLRQEFPNAAIYFKRGNHEERYEAYMFTKAPELLGISELFELDRILGLENLGVTDHGRRERLSVGRLDIIHGHEYGKGGGVNPARWIYLKASATVMIGHLHRTSQHSQPDISGSVTSTWSTGCLCGLSPDYARYNLWNHGFAFIESDGKDFRVDNLRFIDGRIY